MHAVQSPEPGNQLQQILWECLFLVFQGAWELSLAADTNALC
jgi:hypothetical protein